MKNRKNDRKIDEFLGFLEKNAGNGEVLRSFSDVCISAGVDKRKTEALLMEYLGWSGEEIVAKYACSGKDM